MRPLLRLPSSRLALRCGSPVAAAAAAPRALPLAAAARGHATSVASAASSAPVVLARGPGYFVLDKPAGMPLWRGEAAPGERSVEAWLREEKSEDCVGFCQAGASLEAASSGAVFFATSRQVAAEAASLWESRKIVEVFTAILQGHLRLEDPIEIHRRLCKPSEGSEAWRLAGTRSEGREGCSVLRGMRHGSFEGEPCTLAELRPVTKNPQQLRLHCVAAGHPIVGDIVHDADRRLDWRFEAALAAPRLLLHCRSLLVPLLAGTVEADAPEPLGRLLVSGPAPALAAGRGAPEQDSIGVGSASAIAGVGRSAWDAFGGGLSGAVVDDTHWDDPFAGARIRKVPRGPPFGPPEWDLRARPRLPRGEGRQPVE